MIVIRAPDAWAQRAAIRSAAVADSSEVNTTTISCLCPACPCAGTPGRSKPAIESRFELGEISLFETMPKRTVQPLKKTFGGSSG
jgi:hypothetical protein